MSDLIALIFVILIGTVIGGAIGIWIASCVKTPPGKS